MEREKKKTARNFSAKLDFRNAQKKRRMEINLRVSTRAPKLTPTPTPTPTPPAAIAVVPVPTIKPTLSKYTQQDQTLQLLYISFFSLVTSTVPKTLDFDLCTYPAPSF